MTWIPKARNRWCMFEKGGAFWNFRRFISNLHTLSDAPGRETLESASKWGTDALATDAGPVLPRVHGFVSYRMLTGMFPLRNCMVFAQVKTWTNLLRKLFIQGGSMSFPEFEILHYTREKNRTERFCFFLQFQLMTLTQSSLCQQGDSSRDSRTPTTTDQTL